MESMQNQGRLSILYENSNKTAAEVCEIVGAEWSAFFARSCRLIDLYRGSESDAGKLVACWTRKWTTSLSFSMRPASSQQQRCGTDHPFRGALAQTQLRQQLRQRLSLGGTDTLAQTNLSPSQQANLRGPRRCHDRIFSRSCPGNLLDYRTVILAALMLLPASTL
jgi:hypothetical protein